MSDTPVFARVTDKRLAGEITRLEKELVRARKVVAELITENRVLASVSPYDTELMTKFNLDRK